MKRASQIRSVGHWNANDAVDRVVLDADERHRRRTVLTGERGTIFRLDLPHATALRDGDGLVLDDGAIVRVAGKPEALVGVAAADEASGDPALELRQSPGGRADQGRCLRL
jgi:urease accessory protein